MRFFMGCKVLPGCDVGVSARFAIDLIVNTNFDV